MILKMNYEYDKHDPCDSENASCTEKYQVISFIQTCEELIGHHSFMRSINVRGMVNMHNSNPEPAIMVITMLRGVFNIYEKKYILKEMKWLSQINLNVRSLTGKSSRLTLIIGQLEKSALNTG